MKGKIIISLVLLGIVVLAGAISCSQGVSQDEYDILKTQLAEANIQIASQQAELSQAEILETQYTELSTQYDELKDKNNDNLDEIASLTTQIEELGNDNDALTEENEIKTNEIADWIFQYDELKAQYDALIEQPSEITEENIEQALFDLINQERINHDLNVLVPGKNLVEWSQINSQNMSVSKQTEFYSDPWIPFQRAYIAVGYSSLDRVVNAAMAFWQSHALSYEGNILDEDAVYGAVGVVKLGDICYITYMASNYP